MKLPHPVEHIFLALDETKPDAIEKAIQRIQVLFMNGANDGQSADKGAGEGDYQSSTETFLLAKSADEQHIRLVSDRLLEKHAGLGQAVEVKAAALRT